MKKIYTLLPVCLVAMVLVPRNSFTQESCPENLLHFWKFEQVNSGAFIDYIGNLDASTATPPDITEGKVGSSAFFDGNSQVTIPDNAYFDWGKDGSFTLEFWVKKTTACPNQNTSSNNVVIGRDDGITQLHWWAGISCTNPGKVNFTLVSNDGTNQTLETKRGIIDGNWHLIGVVRDGVAKTTSIFIDGEVDTTATYTFTDNFGSIAPVTVGWLDAGLEYHFEGYLDELALYNTALQASDFMDHYNSGTGKAYCQTEPEPVDSGPYSLTVNFSGMTSIVDKEFSLFVVNHNTMERLDSITVVMDSAYFVVVFDSLRADSSYNFDIWSDKNENGKYNVPPLDEAWRIELLNISSDTVIDFAYNTNYTNIFNVTDTDTTHFRLTINLTGFEPEVDRDMTIYVRNPDNGDFIDSLKLNPVDDGDFSVEFDSLLVNTEYNIDMFTDVNSDSAYNAPPLDHAWRLELPGIKDDTVVIFAYNTIFTDIFPADTTGEDSTYTISLNFSGFTNSIGKNLLLYLRNPDNQEFVDSLAITPVDTGDFTLVLNSVEIVSNYHIDFYTDVNANGSYDVPPTDYAWRIQLVNVNADTTILVVYDTNYVDIGLIQTGTDKVDYPVLNIYPNPAGDDLEIQLEEKGISLNVFSLSGSLVLQRHLSPSERHITLNISALKPGMYILRLTHSGGVREARFVKR